ncbi:MAG: DegV family protein [Chloroflexi bacterium]|nr:DegV family protein [Chloroflexota bacterium]MBC7315223.1 DegV family protein [Chloroflexota bacterium]
MARVAVITDSVASLPEGLIAEYGLIVVPYYVHVQGQALRDGVDIGTQAFAEYLLSLPEDAELPKTANPGPGEYEAAYLQAAEHTREIISLHMTSRGSGAYQTALVGRGMALKHRPDLDIRVVDTRNVSMCHGWMSLQAARAAAKGASLEEIMALVQRMIPVARMLQTADTLRYLYMGGRIGRAQHLVGSLLNIKPIISMEEGEIVIAGLARSRQRAYRRMAELVAKAVPPGEGIRLALTHVAALDEAETLRTLVAEEVHVVETLLCELSPALAVHSGPGTVGLCYVPEGVSRV